MKCIEIEKNIDLLLDDEANLLQKQEIKAHLEICNSCQTKFEVLQKTKGLLQQQPVILPSNSFDNRMLQAFENKLNSKPTPKESWFARLFSIPKPAFALMLALFAVGLGLAFLVGRLSVSSPSQLANSEPKIENKQPENKPNTQTAPINETAAKYIGLKNPVGEILKWDGVPFKIIGIPDEYTVTGSQSEIFNHYGISEEGLSATAIDLLKQLDKSSDNDANYETIA